MAYALAVETRCCCPNSRGPNSVHPRARSLRRGPPPTRLPRRVCTVVDVRVGTVHMRNTGDSANSNRVRSTETNSHASRYNDAIDVILGRVVGIDTSDTAIDACGDDPAATTTTDPVVVVSTTESMPQSNSNCEVDRNELAEGAVPIRSAIDAAKEEEEEQGCETDQQDVHSHGSPSGSVYAKEDGSQSHPHPSGNDDSNRSSGSKVSEDHTHDRATRDVSCGSRSAQASWHRRLRCCWASQHPTHTAAVNRVRNEDRDVRRRVTWSIPQSFSAVLVERASQARRRLVCGIPSPTALHEPHHDADSTTHTKELPGINRTCITDTKSLRCNHPCRHSNSYALGMLHTSVTPVLSLSPSQPTTVLYDVAESAEQSPIPRVVSAYSRPLRRRAVPAPPELMSVYARIDTAPPATAAAANGSTDVTYRIRAVRPCARNVNEHDTIDATHGNPGTSGKDACMHSFIGNNSPLVHAVDRPEHSSSFRHSPHGPHSSREQCRAGPTRSRSSYSSSRCTDYMEPSLTHLRSHKSYSGREDRNLSIGELWNKNSLSYPVNRRQGSASGGVCHSTSSSMSPHLTPLPPAKASLCCSYSLSASSSSAAAMCRNLASSLRSVSAESASERMKQAMPRKFMISSSSSNRNRKDGNSNVSHTMDVDSGAWSSTKMANRAKRPTYGASDANSAVHCAVRASRAHSGERERQQSDGVLHTGTAQSTRRRSLDVLMHSDSSAEQSDCGSRYGESAKRALRGAEDGGSLSQQPVYAEERRMTDALLKCFPRLPSPPRYRSEGRHHRHSHSHTCPGRSRH